MRALIFGLFALGCHDRHDDFHWDTGNNSQDDDSAAADSADSGGDDDEHHCDQVTLDLLGPEEPVVGDTWVIWMSCDDARLIGPLVISFDPTDFATLDDNVAVFQYAGTATLRVRSGTYDLSTEVTVTE